MKNNLFKRSLTLTAMGVAFLAMISFTADQDNGWKVPDEYKTKKNPVTADDESIDIGKELYAKHCRSCHGKYGEGDGPKAEELDSDCGDFTTEDFQAQTDGTLFYKVKFGKDEMPAFGKKISYDEDFWHLVNYLRTLGE